MPPALERRRDSDGEHHEQPEPVARSRRIDGAGQGIDPPYAQRDDGNGELWTTSWDRCDLPSIRHDARNINLPDTATTAGVPNSKRKSNILFLDGHADFVPRNYSCAKAHCAPKPDQVTGTEIVIAN